MLLPPPIHRSIGQRSSSDPRRHHGQYSIRSRSSQPCTSSTTSTSIETNDPAGDVKIRLLAPKPIHAKPSSSPIRSASSGRHRVISAPPPLPPRKPTTAAGRICKSSSIPSALTVMPSNPTINNGSSSSHPSSPTDGSEPINFRAALAAFENHAQPQTKLTINPTVHAPTPRSPRSSRPSPVAIKNPSSDFSSVARTPSKNLGDVTDPVSRSSSTPRIRRDSNESRFSTSNPFSSQSETVSIVAPSLPSTSASGMLSAPRSPHTVAIDLNGKLRKSESGTSLRELMQKSMPDANPINTGLHRNRSKSLAGREASFASSSASASGRSTPAGGHAQSHSRSGSPHRGVKNFIAMYGGAHAPTSSAALDLNSSIRSSSPLSISSNTSLRTSANMLDTSHDDDYSSPMFGHAVMQPGRSSTKMRPSSSGLRSAPTSGRSSPERRNSNASSISSNQSFADAQSTLHPPPIPSRKGSGSSTSSLPRLPPRPASLAPSPTITEFGQVTTPRRESGPSGNAYPSVHPGYATYTPGVKRQGHAQGGQRGVNPLDHTKSPPTLPPRSATVGQAFSDRSNARLASGQPESSPRTAGISLPAASEGNADSDTPAGTTPKAKPVPPPRPTGNALVKPWEGSAGGFRFGEAQGSKAATSTTNASAQPRPSSRPSQGSSITTHQRSLTGGSRSSALSRGGSHQGHAKHPSGVFTSISLSDDASHELKRSLETDMRRDGSTGSFQQPPPPSRGRPSHGTSRGASGGGGIGSSISPSGITSLLGSAASALPLPSFISNTNTSSTSKALAEGAPSKQGSFVSRSSSGSHGYHDAAFLSVRPGQAMMEGRRSSTPTLVNRPGWAGQTQTRAVMLADPKPVRLARSIEPADAAARKRYEALFDAVLRAQLKSRARKDQKGDRQNSSNASTLRGVSRDESVVSDGATQDADADADADADTSGASARSVQSLRGWFESENTQTSSTVAAKPTGQSRLSVSAPDKDSSTLIKTSRSSTVNESEISKDMSISAKRVSRIWRRSRLPESILAEIWDAALNYQDQVGSEGGKKVARLGRESFVRAMAAIDAELARRKSRAAEREKRLMLRNRSMQSINGTTNKSSMAGSLRNKHLAPQMAPTMSSSSNSSSRHASPPSHESALPSTSNAGAAPAVRRIPPPPPPKHHPG